MSLAVAATPDIRAQAALLGSRPGVCLEERNFFHGVFITHAHVGHYVGLLQFGKEALCTRQLPVYCSARFAELMRSNEPFRSLVVDERISLVVIAPGESIRLPGGASVTAIAVKHRSELSDTLAFIIRGGDAGGPSRGLLFCPDADDWSWPVEEALRGIDVALLDGTFYSDEELPGRELSTIPHPLISSSVDRLGALAATTRIFFTHFNHSNRLLVDAELLPPPFGRLEDGQEFDMSPGIAAAP